MPVNEIIDVALRFVECVNHKDVDGIAEMLASNSVLVDLEGNETPTNADVWHRHFQLLPRYTIHIADAWAVGDTCVLAGRTTGSHVDLLLEEEFRQKLLWSARIKQEKLLVWQVYFDRLATRRKLGVPYFGARSD